MWIESLLERNYIPDFIIRFGIRKLLKQRLLEESKGDIEQNQTEFIQLLKVLKESPIAVNTTEANEQHYEVPSNFYKIVLGASLKYSCCYFETGNETLSEAESKMLKLTCERAEIEDGMTILELGCGWGSLSLFMALTFPKCEIVGVSNSKTQKEYIDEQIRIRNLTNLTIVTSDINTFQIDRKFDRVVSVEMFEHMRNYELLMDKVSSFLLPEGKLFVHIFTHKLYSYLFEVKDDSDWMAKYFFTGGTMPSDYLLLYFQKNLKIDQHWRVNGNHYSKTSEEWLKNMDANKTEIMTLFDNVYGKSEALKWWVYWRIFFMSCAELWGYNKGNEWFVSHYLFKNEVTH